MNILSSIQRETMRFFEQSLLPALNAQQKRIGTIALVALSCLAACYALYRCCFKERKIEHLIEIQGHRFFRGLFPENSLPAFRAAIQHGVTGVETDLLLTSDEQVVTFHDFSLDPVLCTSMDGAPIKETPFIKDLTLSELRQIDCGRLQHPNFPRQQAIPQTSIPTLDELFAIIHASPYPHAKKMILNLEVKADPCQPHAIPDYKLVARRIVEKVQKGGCAQQVYYSSFDFDLLSEIRKIDAHTPFGLLIETPSLTCKGVDPQNWIPYIIEQALKLKASIVSPEHVLLTRENVKAAHEAGLRVIPWTVNDLEVAVKLIDEFGVDGLITDYPVDMQKLIENRQKATRL